MKKINFLFAVSSALFLSSCSTFSSSSGTIIPESSDENSNEQINNTIININETVQINKGEYNKDPSTLEEAVESVYDSVVIIQATLSNGTSTGSGVLFGESDNYSYILTCHHVIDEAYSISVTLSNAQKYTAYLIGGDSETDIAVLAIEQKDLCYATLLDDSDTLKLGQSVFAVGNPLGIGSSVTSGIISAKSRTVTYDDGSQMDLLQTDAAINSGNSGGGLFDLQGQLVGIVNAKYSATGVEGLGFAIPINTALYIANDLLEDGKVEGRYYLGVTITDGYYSSGYGMLANRYPVVYISAISQTGSAYHYLEVEDILVSIKIDYVEEDMQDISLSTISSASQVTSFIQTSNAKAEDKIVFEVKRGGYDVTTTFIDVVLMQYQYVMPTK